MRRQSPEVTSRSQSSDSQSGTADAIGTEGVDPYSRASQRPASPLNQKRTRTIATPHQSAVLHALLAQVSYALLSCWRALIISWLCLFSDPIPNNSDAGGGRTFYWAEFEESAGQLLSSAFQLRILLIADTLF
jgi:hypothetical protein